MSLTRRRESLDRLLFSHSHLMAGNVLDVGGKRERTRGMFRPPTSGVMQWHYLNTDAETKPDFLCDAHDMSQVDAATYDVVLLCEVLEHVSDPSRVLAECSRVLKPGGRLIMSMPFLNAVHADPHDYQRWTAYRIEKELAEAGLAAEEVAPMGGAGSVVHDLLILPRKSFTARMAARASLWLTAPFLKILDRASEGDARATTGYFVLARRTGAA